MKIHISYKYKARLKKNRLTRFQCRKWDSARLSGALCSVKKRKNSNLEVFFFSPLRAMWNLSPKAVSRHCEILDGRCIGFISWTEEVGIPMLRAAEPSFCLTRSLTLVTMPSASPPEPPVTGSAPSLCTGQYTQQSFPLMVLCSSSSQLMISLSAHCLPGLNPWLQVTAV